MGRWQICANENFPGQAVHALRENGHDVLWMAEQGPRTADVDVLALADAEGRLLVTFDKDFGELAVRRRLRATSGIVLLNGRDGRGGNSGAGPRSLNEPNSSGTGRCPNVNQRMARSDTGLLFT
jgi:hypothetical protein